MTDHDPLAEALGLDETDVYTMTAHDYLAALDAAGYEVRPKASPNVDFVLGRQFERARIRASVEQALSFNVSPDYDAALSAVLAIIDGADDA